MTTLHIQLDCRDCQELAEALEATALVHELVIHPTEPSPPEREPVGPHTMVDDGEVFAGHDAVRRHIDDLVRLKHDWTLFQSDVCYGGE